MKLLMASFSVPNKFTMQQTGRMHVHVRWMYHLEQQLQVLCVNS